MRASLLATGCYMWDYSEVVLFGADCRLRARTAQFLLPSCARARMRQMAPVVFSFGPRGCVRGDKFVQLRFCFQCVHIYFISVFYS